MTPWTAEQILARLRREQPGEPDAALVESPRRQADLDTGGVLAVGTTLPWAVEVDPGSTPTLLFCTHEGDGAYARRKGRGPGPDPFVNGGTEEPLRRVGSGGLHLGRTQVPNLSATRYRFLVDGRIHREGWATVEVFTSEPDCRLRPGVQRGIVSQHRRIGGIYPATSRDYWLQVPANLAGDLNPPREQARALAFYTILDAFHRNVPGIDWRHALRLMVADLRRSANEDFLARGGTL